MPKQLVKAAVTFGVVSGSLVLVASLRSAPAESLPPTPQGSGQATRVFPRGPVRDDAVLPAQREVRVLRRIGQENTLGFPLEIHAAAERISVFDRMPIESDEQLLVIDRETGRVLHRAGPPGEGPGDVMASISLDTFPAPSPLLSIFDYRRGRVSLYDLDPWEATPSRFLVTSDGPQGRALLWLTETTAVMNGFFSGHLLRFYEVRESPENALASRLEFAAQAGTTMFPDAPTHAQARLDLNMIAVRPDRALIAVAFINASRVAIFDPEGRPTSLAQGPEVETWILPDGEIHKERNEIAYRDVAASQDRIYGLFVGYAGGGGDPATVIHGYTWEGELVDVIRLEEGINFMDFDAVSGRLFGTTLEPYPEILEYDLGNL